jgi:hypothetical protein
MKVFKIFLVAIFVIVLISYGQEKESESNNIVGFWQRNTWGAASGWGDSYLFYPDHTFKFYFKQNMAVENRICGLIGTYRISGDSIYFLPTVTYEYIGGQLVKDPPSGKEWTLLNAKETLVKQQRSLEQSAWFERCDTTVPCIRIDEAKFYRVNKNPNHYFGK